MGLSLSNGDEDVGEGTSSSYGTRGHSRAPNYFQLLEVANEAGSIPGTPRVRLGNIDSVNAMDEHDEGSAEGRSSRGYRSEGENVFGSGGMAEGYFETFFKEEYRLGMGANGSYVT